MLRTLVKKEIAETILDLRFVIASLLCIILIPLGMYVSRKDYERRLADYRREHQIYRENYAQNVGAEVQAQGFRRPSMLSIFASGLEPFIPDKVITSRSGLFSVVKNPGATNPQALLFGKTDILYIVTHVVSLVALLFTFKSISGEKEAGTLRLTIANSVPRSQILVSKIFGCYTTLLVPFVISLLVALIVLDASPDISILSPQLWPALLVIIFVSLLFLFAMTGLGVCVSTHTRSAITSLVVMLLVWVVFVLAVPKVSPMMAEVIYPIESQDVISLRKQVTAKNFEREFDQKRGELFDKCRTAFGVSTRGVSNIPSSEADKKAYAKYERELPPLTEEYDKHRADAIRRIEQDYKNKQNIQASIAVNFSRISPVSCYSYLVSALSGMGVAELNNFNKNAQRYQDEVKSSIYDNFVIKSYGGKGRGRATTVDAVDGFDQSQAVIPDMNYEYTTLAQALQNGWVDLTLLLVFSTLFFLVAFLRFNRYDVR